MHPPSTREDGIERSRRDLGSRILKAKHKDIQAKPVLLWLLWESHCGQLKFFVADSRKRFSLAFRVAGKQKEHDGRKSMALFERDIPRC